MTLEQELKEAVKEWRAATGADERKRTYAECVALAVRIFAGQTNSRRKRWKR